MSPTNAANLTIENLRAGAVADPSVQFLLAAQTPPDPNVSVAELILREKATVASRLPALKDILEKSPLDNVSEEEHQVTLSTGFTSRVIVVGRKPGDGTEKAPIIVLFHGGGWVMGYPESQVAFARNATLATGAVFLLPSYGLAPERVFPGPIDDAWALVQLVAKEAALAPEKRLLLPANADAAAGFIVGGMSAGANLSAVIAHLARDSGLQPRLTGQFLSCGLFMAPLTSSPIPGPYAPRWLSYVDNSNAPILPRAAIDGIIQVLQPEPTNGRFAPFAWPDYETGVDAEGRVGKGHVGLPSAYLQATGMDAVRDDTLVYETVLREESGVPTRLDFYPGFPHSVWGFFKDLEIRKRWEADTVEGLKWLLEEGKR